MAQSSNLKNLPRIAFVAPCFNEELVVGTSIQTFLKKLNELIDRKEVSKDSFICLVDDGSRDNTWKIIQEHVNAQAGKVKGIKLIRNFGQQQAIFAGLMNTIDLYDIVITLDVDLQDDINAVDEFIQKYKEGYEIVFGVKITRARDGIFKKYSALFFYGLMKLLKSPIIANHSEYRLITKNVVNTLAQFKGKNLVLRVILPSLGYHSICVNYNQKSRKSGKTKYSLSKMFSLAAAITSYSYLPLRLISLLGMSLTFIGGGMGLWIVIRSIIGEYPLTLISSFFSTAFFLSGIQLLALGMISEYIARMYAEIKQDPSYIIETSNFNS